MANAYILLDRVGGGYCIPDRTVSRGDEPMCVERFFIGGVPSGPGDYNTGFPWEQYCACICGWNWDQFSLIFQNLKMEKGPGGTWLITWFISDPTGINACIDVCFVKRAICKDNIQPLP
jgi:hypothetical protein